MLLIGGLIMPAQAHNFTIRVDAMDSEAKKNVTVYFNGKEIGKTNETGQFIYPLNDLKLGEERVLILKKEGFNNTPVTVYKNPHGGCDNGVMLAMQPITPEPTPEIFPTAPPLPEGHKSQKQRITELENIIAEHETKISWLEGKIKGILQYIKDKFGDIL